MRRKWISLLVLAAACCGALVPALGLASSVTTTGNATSIGSTHVVLNGVINPTYPDNAWFFQYATTPDFAHGAKATRPVAVGSGVHAVSATVKGLAAGTVYYYRVGVVAQPDTTQAPVYHLGDTASFTTAGPFSGTGTASVVAKAIRVSGGRARVVLRCRGHAGARCAGALGLIAQSRGKLVSCGSGRFSLRAPNRRTVAVRPASACRALIRSARRRRVTAALIAVFSTDQAKFAERVTLAG